MAYKYEPRRLRIEFDDLAGLVVKARPLTIDELLAVVRLEMAAAADRPDEVEELLDRFLGTVSEWNLEDGDGPVLLTRDAIGGLDHGFFKSVLRGWMRAVTEVPDPLGERSASGETSPEVSLPMDPL